MGVLEIDVITPVLNNRQFIERSIQSAHNEPVVKSVIVVDDGSRDGTWELLNDLKQVFPKLVVLCHPGNVNRGIAASRNRGIRHATAAWIAFLDSDDYYLPGRFNMVKQRTEADPSIEGVYEPVVNEVLSEEAVHKFKRGEAIHGSVIGINPDRDPAKAFESMYYGAGGGAVHLNGLTIRRELAHRVGLFDEHLRIVDDSVFRLKVTYVGRFARGSTSPVAVRTIHDTNSEPNIKPFDVYMKHKTLFDFFLSRKASKRLVRNSVKRLITFYVRYKGGGNAAKRILITALFILRNPKLILKFI